MALLHWWEHQYTGQGVYLTTAQVKRLEEAGVWLSYGGGKYCVFKGNRTTPQFSPTFTDGGIELIIAAGGETEVLSEFRKYGKTEVPCVFENTKGKKIALYPDQIKRLEEAGVWLKEGGVEYLAARANGDARRFSDWEIDFLIANSGVVETIATALRIGQKQVVWESEPFCPQYERAEYETTESVYVVKLTEIQQRAWSEGLLDIGQYEDDFRSQQGSFVVKVLDNFSAIAEVIGRVSTKEQAIKNAQTYIKTWQE